ncbi:MAG: DNA primase [Euryarchaeota archaeon]|nr:DNA primase [Euryarchaeota archaeon]
MKEEERLERIEKWLEALIEENREVPVVVEGAKDEAALRRLGLAGPIIRINAGSQIFTLCEGLARSHARAIVLVDWDRTGGRLARLLSEGLEANQVKADLGFRRRFVRLAQGEIKDIESAFTFIARLRETAAP